MRWVRPLRRSWPIIEYKYVSNRRRVENDHSLAAVVIGFYDCWSCVNIIAIKLDRFIDFSKIVTLEESKGVGVYFDVSKSFDTVLHKKLIHTW